MKNLTSVITTLIWLAVASCEAQQASFSWFQTRLEDKPNVNTVTLQVPRKFEIWLIDFTAPKPSLELLGPQLLFKDAAGLFRVGAYLRFIDSNLTRLGLAGLVSVGNAKGWQLVSPFYLFQERNVNDLTRTGFWLPNLRLSYPVSTTFRLGAGVAMTNVQGKPVSLVIGPYLAYEHNDLLFQLRVGQQLSPRALAGRTQIFAGLTYRFKTK